MKRRPLWLALLSIGLTVFSASGFATIQSPRDGIDPAAASTRPSSPSADQTLSTIKVSAVSTPPARDLWAELRKSFVLDDCGGDDPTAVAHWTQLFTASPGHFEANLRRTLPSLRYIQQVAQQRGIPGEFVLLPWVESHYLPIFKQRDRPVGMWQIMPKTAKSLGLQVNHQYDARLDTAATTDAILELIDQYHDQYHDWRLADYAFNSGTGTVNRLLDRYGTPPATPVIPHLPAPRITREHLIKLLAIACIIRHPQQYAVKLPHLPAAERLEPVVIPKAMPVAAAAAKAGLPATQLTQINSAFLNGTIDPQRTETLLLPRANVQHWYQYQSKPGQDALLGSKPEAASHASSSSSRSNQHRLKRPPAHRYSVKAGDSLWSIAKRHHLSSQQLMRWNHLSKPQLRLGQTLRLAPP